MAELQDDKREDPLAAVCRDLKFQNYSKAAQKFAKVCKGFSADQMQPRVTELADRTSPHELYQMARLLTQDEALQKCLRDVFLRRYEGSRDNQIKSLVQYFKPEPEVDLAQATLPSKRNPNAGDAHRVLGQKLGIPKTRR